VHHGYTIPVWGYSSREGQLYQLGPGETEVERLRLRRGPGCRVQGEKQ
jgi:hypothetical protein